MTWSPTPQQFWGLENVAEFSLLTNRGVYLNAASERYASFKPGLAEQLIK